MEQEQYAQEIVKDDTCVFLEDLATNVQLTDRQRQRRVKKEQKQQEKEAKSGKDNIPDPQNTSVYTKLEEDKDVTIKGKKYKVKKITNKKNGYQSVVFEDSESKKCVHAIAGSFPLTEPWANPLEWLKDWVFNNLAIAFGKLPPQLDTAIKDLDECKKEYNIEKVVGFSLGAILAGLLSKFKRNKETISFLYNGGLPEKLNYPLLKEYGDEIDLGKPTNIHTSTANNEPISNLISINPGGSMHEKTENSERTAHNLGNLRNNKNSKYEEIVYQSGMGFADTLTTYAKPTENGGIEAGISFSPTLGNTKVKAGDEEDTEPIKPVNYIKRLPKKKTKNDKNIKTVSNEIKRLIPPDSSDYSRVAPYLIGKILGVSLSDEISSTTNDNKEEYDKYLTSVMKHALGHEQLFRGINAFEKDKFEGFPSYAESSLQKEIPPRIVSGDSVSSAITREILPHRENHDDYFANEQMEDFLRNTLDDFIIRMGFDMHDYN